MFAFILAFVVTICSAEEVGKIVKILGGSDAYIMRSGQKINAAVDLGLELKDEVHASDSVVVLHVFPSSQLSLAKNTQLVLSEATNDDETMNGDTIVDFIKGMVRASLVKEAGEQSTQKIRAKDVAFAVRGTEYEISYDGEGVELDVIEGEVEVSSPEVNTFAPEVVKANEGLRFSRKEKGFKRRKFASRFKDHPGFLKREEVRARFKKIREMRKTRRAQNRDARIEKRHDRKEARKHRREERRKNKK